MSCRAGALEDGCQTNHGEGRQTGFGESRECRTRRRRPGRIRMANLRPERTGLPYVVFISQRAGARDDVRVKIAPSTRVRLSEMVTVALRPSVRVVRGRFAPRDLDLLRRWIDLNQQVLIDYWNGTIGYTEDAMNALRPVEDMAC